MSLEDLLQSQKERELDRIDGQKDQLEQRYAQLPAMVETVAALLDMPPEQVVRACAQAAWHYKDMDWSTVMEIVRSFKVAANRLTGKE